MMPAIIPTKIHVVSFFFFMRGLPWLPARQQVGERPKLVRPVSHSRPGSLPMLWLFSTGRARARQIGELQIKQGRTRLPGCGLVVSVGWTGDHPTGFG